MTGKDGRVGFGIIGLGIGLSRCEMMQEAPEARLVAVADLVEDKAKSVAAKFGADWYTDYHKMLEREDIDVVGVYTPSGLHLNIALDVARAGKHVLTTKPMEITLERADAIISAAKEAGVKLATEFASRYSTYNYALYRAIRDGKFGKMVLGEFNYKCYRDQAYYESNGGWRGTWKVDGGGAIMNQTIHSVDQMLWLMGDVETVTARWGTYTHKIETEDTAVALITFKSGAMGVLVGTTTFHNDRPFKHYGGGVTRRSEINGEFGSATMIDDVTKMWKTVEGEVPSQVSLPAVNVFQDYSRWVLDDNYSSPTLAKAEDSRKTLELVLAVYESARSGKTVTLPL
ncbi:MAG: Gfo/Idh/MocA family oxidoreductase [Bacteroidetes bacterium]|nr:Gfo/Idh/MocA family oxidoreductase [Bacteroidota bacterium]